MKMRTIISILSSLLFLLNCVPSYQRYIEGIYDNNSRELMAVLDALLREQKYEKLFVTVSEEIPPHTVIASYFQYDDAIRQALHINIRLKDIDEKGETEFVISVNALGWQNPTVRAVDNAFEVLVSTIESRLTPIRLKITKKC